MPAQPENINQQTLEYDCLLMTKHKHATRLHGAAAKVRPITRHDTATLVILVGEQPEVCEQAIDCSAPPQFCLVVGNQLQLGHATGL